VGGGGRWSLPSSWGGGELRAEGWGAKQERKEQLEEKTEERREEGKERWSWEEGETLIREGREETFCAVA